MISERHSKKAALGISLLLLYCGVRYYLHLRHYETLAQNAKFKSVKVVSRESTVLAPSEQSHVQTPSAEEPKGHEPLKPDTPVKSEPSLKPDTPVKSESSLKPETPVKSDLPLKPDAPLTSEMPPKLGLPAKLQDQDASLTEGLPKPALGSNILYIRFENNFFRFHLLKTFDLGTAEWAKFYSHRQNLTLKESGGQACTYCLIVPDASTLAQTQVGPAPRTLYLVRQTNSETGCAGELTGLTVTSQEPEKSECVIGTSSAGDVFNQPVVFKANSSSRFRLQIKSHLMVTKIFGGSS